MKKNTFLWWSFILVICATLMIWIGQPLLWAETSDPTPTLTPTPTITPTPTRSISSSIQLEAESCDTYSGVSITNGEVVECDEGDWICFKNINFDVLRVPIPTGGYTPQFIYTVKTKIYQTYEVVPQVLVKLDSLDNSPRATIGMYFSLQDQGYREFGVYTNQIPPTGPHDVYLQFVGVEDIGCFDYLNMSFRYARAVTGTPTLRPSPTPIRPPGPAIEPVNGVTAISAGYAHSFAYRNSNAVMAWGENNHLQVYNVSSVRINPYTTNLTQIKAVNAGCQRSAAVKLDGTLWMWGFTGYSISTDGFITFSNTPDPVQISGLTGVVKTVGGRSHQVALKSDGTVWALLDNTFGQLGNSSTAPSLNPVQVTGLTGITDIAAGYDHVLALKSDGTVWAWGYNHFGQLGNGVTAVVQNIPVQVAGLADIVAIAGGGGHSAALDRNGSVWTWGSNYFGQLGDGTKSRRLTPVLVSGLTGVSAISAGMWHTVALKNDGTLWTWGDRSRGQLGVSGLTENAVAPVQVPGLNGFTAVSAGAYFNLALKNDTTVWSWGYNINGQLGIGYASLGTQPTQAGLLTGTLTPTVTPTPTATPTPTPTRRRVTISPTRRVTPTPTPTPPGGYLVTYKITSDWGNGANADVIIKNNTSSAVNGWTLNWTFPGNQTITNMWNASYTQSGASVSAKNLSYNAMIAANGGTQSFGFGMRYSGTNAKPTAFTLNGTVCQVQ